MKKTICQIQTAVALAIASTLITGSALSQPDYSFSSPPRLDRSTAAKRSFAKVNGNSYSFTMTLPRRSASRFTKLSFSVTNLDRANAIVPLPLSLQETVAQVKTMNDRSQSIPVKGAFIDEAGTVWVEFNSSLPANTVLTIVFKTRAPLLAGQYAYQIAAYPEAMGVSPAFVGDGTFRAAK
ncbi:DUF2808 domain-containing protein [Cyanobacteria bacterium FACHB-63]|nr:DUF2808 domain-containing protein [Cyanobacteria bacterium FACHB-63]